MEKQKSRLRRYVDNTLAALGVAGVLGLTGLAGLAGYNYRQHQIKSAEHVERFGTRENPVYSITAESPKIERLDTYFSVFGKSFEGEIAKYKAITKAIEDDKNGLVTFEGRLDKLEKRVDELAHKKELTGKEQSERIEIRTGISVFSSYLIERNAGYLDLELSIGDKDLKQPLSRAERSILQIISAQKTREFEEKEYGDVKERAKRLFRKMTGREVPADTRLDIEDIADQELAGFYSSQKGEAVAKDASYASTLSVFIHELGHLACQQADEFRIKNYPNPCDRKALVIDEAAAYAFQFAGQFFEENDDLKKHMSLLSICGKEDLIEEFFNEEQEYHREALALADAAVTHFQDPVKAYNYLATTPYDEVAPEIFQIIERNRKAFFSKEPAANKAKSEINSIMASIGKLEKRVDSLKPRLEKKHDTELEKALYKEYEMQKRKH